jgi:thiopeptide-type bacteriocin biosynthesis protein
LRVEPTVFLGALKREVEAETSQSSKQDAGTALDVARKKVLLGILASREKQRRGYALGTERVTLVTDWFSKSHGVPTGAGLDVWLAARGLTQTMFDQAMQRFAAVVEAQDQLAEDIERELPAYWKLHPASDGGDAQWTQINVSLDRARGTAARSARRLFRRLMPLVTTERRLLRIESFHFTRKTPDLRLRFFCRGSADRLIRRLEGLLRGSRSGIDAAFPSVYEPEYRLFGGALAMDAVHRYFEQDSLMAMRWLEGSRSVDGVGSAALCLGVVDDLFARALQGGSEIWDAWNIVHELSSTRSPGPGDESAAFAVRLSKHETSMLRSYRRANAGLADALVSLWHQGSLGVGLRMLVAYVAMFHFNRYGLDGTVQADVARFAIDRRNPTVTAASRGPADRG